MRLDPRTPVLVGVGQVNHQGGDAPEPVDLLAEAARRAATDSHAPSLLDKVSSVRVVNLLTRRYPDPGALVAERVAPHATHTLLTAMGGNMPQVLLDRTAADIAAGDLDVALIGGAESWKTRNAYRARDERPPWSTQDPRTRPDEVLGGELTVGDPEEAAHGLALPVQYYPLFESALRVRAKETMAEHAATVAELWSTFSAVAAHNPYAAVPRAHSPEEIATPSPANRMICFPYTKLLNSNNSVDQAAALIMCSAEAAAAAGVPAERWVFLHGAAEATDAGVSYRDDLAASPAIRVAGRAALDLAGVAPDELAFVDLYSCFPSAVQVAAAELGLPLTRRLTVTGGLTFAGGPWNNYVTHAIATMVPLLREAPDAFGLCSANGGMLSKHAVAVYSARPSAALAPVADVQARVDAFPHRSVAVGHQGDATVEAYTVAHDRAGAPDRAFVAALLPDGRRAWATSDDPDVLGELERHEGCGRPATLAAGTISLC